MKRVRGGWDVVPVIAASRYGDVGVSINVGALAVELGGGGFMRGEDWGKGE